MTSSVSIQNKLHLTGVTLITKRQEWGIGTRQSIRSFPTQILPWSCCMILWTCLLSSSIHQFYLHPYTEKWGGLYHMQLQEYIKKKSTVHGFWHIPKKIACLIILRNNNCNTNRIWTLLPTPREAVKSLRGNVHEWARDTMSHSSTMLSAELLLFMIKKEKKKKIDTLS